MGEKEERSSSKEHKCKIQKSLKLNKMLGPKLSVHHDWLLSLPWFICLKCSFTSQFSPNFFYSLTNSDTVKEWEGQRWISLVQKYKKKHVFFFKTVFTFFELHKGKTNCNATKLQFLLSSKLETQHRTM